MFLHCPDPNGDITTRKMIEVFQREANADAWIQVRCLLFTCSTQYTVAPVCNAAQKQGLQHTLPLRLFYLPSALCLQDKDVNDLHGDFVSSILDAGMTQTAVIIALEC